VRQTAQASLGAAGIETLVHYPMPLTDQPAFASYRRHECPVAARATRELLSLPLNPGLSAQDVGMVVSAVQHMDRRDVLA
jgi:dTDP-4-amino-4,6-dideoxygalactose transaminase